MISQPHSEIAALIAQGHALSGLGHLVESAQAYHSALDILRAIGRPNKVTEPLAGLARVALASGDIAGASRHVESILSHLLTRTLEGTDEPLRVYLTCYHVLQAAGDPRADGILSTAYTLLHEQAGKITDETMRRSFLENVPYHREIVAAWAAAQARERSE
jgi:hypothetical protein